MNNVVKLDSASASMTYVNGNVLLLRLSGLLTVDALSHFAGAAMTDNGDWAQGFVLDYRGAVLAADLAKLAHSLTGFSAASPMRRPGAFVGDDHQADRLRAHARAMVCHGFRRRVFADTASAHHWLLGVLLEGD